MQKQEVSQVNASPAPSGFCVTHTLQAVSGLPRRFLNWWPGGHSQGHLHRDDHAQRETGTLRFVMRPCPRIHDHRPPLQSLSSRFHGIEHEIYFAIRYHPYT